MKDLNLEKFLVRNTKSSTPLFGEATTQHGRAGY